MATTEDIEKYCRNCISRDFITRKGLVCKRSGELPAFESECETFEKDEELLKMAPPKPDDFPISMTDDELFAEEDLSKGLLYASMACLLGAVAWVLVSLITGYKIGYMAIGIGFLVGYAMRKGKGVRPIFGICGALLALISCLLGDFITIVGLASKESGLSFFEVLVTANYHSILSVMVENVASISTLFYGIAVYEGYKFSFRAEKRPQGGKI